ncbi:MAG: cytidine deaminase [Ignavibacteriae bacterium]|nr:cytidine deaminase [Ignavibacteriota bacterium]NOH00411.1 cytidine deaminase [Ignavibacteriota bacterium]
MDYKELAQKAIDAKSKAVATYSNFHVGSAILTKAGKIYQGANIENSSYGLTICAERTAVFTAVLDGEREFEAVAIASDLDGFCSPCGACRQVLLDLCGKDVDIVLVDSKSNLRTYKLQELIPHSFGEENLK